jgi:hypothetical protein
VDLKYWRDIDWQPIDALTGGTRQFTSGLGLAPWYIKAFKPSKLPGALHISMPNIHSQHCLLLEQRYGLQDHHVCKAIHC